MTDFIRINQPRIDKINDILAMIRKSATSQDVAMLEVMSLMGEVKLHLPPSQETVEAPTTPQAKKAPALPMSETPHYHRIGAFVDNLPAEHLEYYIGSITGRLCEIAAIERRK